MVKALIVLILSLMPAAQAADGSSFVDGLAAYDAGRYEETVRIWQELAAQGDAMAQLGLAGLYRSGEGVRRDLAEAARLYRLAARQGNPDAQVNLARLLLEGGGIQPDPIEAHAWLSLAAAKGKRYAMERLEWLERTMSDDQLERAERRLAELRERL